MRKSLIYSITKSQIKKIHTLKSKLKIKDEEYRDNLYGHFGVETSKELSRAQAALYIDKLENEAVKAGVWKKHKWDYTHLDGRPYMATSAQIRMIKGMWKDVCRADEKERDKALRKLLLKIVKVSDVRFLERDQVKKIIAALSAMKKQNKAKEKKAA